MSIKILFSIIYLSIVFVTSAQINDSSARRFPWTLELKQKETIKVLNGAKNYLSNVLGTKIVSKNTVFDKTLSGKFQYRPDKSRSYFELYYYLVKDNDTIDSFILITDTTGKPTKFNNSLLESASIELLTGYKKLIENKIHINRKKAIQLGIKNGFHSTPTFECLLDKNVVTYYWHFLESEKDQSLHELILNAQTGVITKNTTMMKMPK